MSFVRRGRAAPASLAPSPSVATAVLADRTLEAHLEAVKELSAMARRAYRLLLALGLELLARRLGRGLPKNLSQVVAFAVNRLLAFALGPARPPSTAPSRSWRGRG